MHTKFLYLSYLQVDIVKKGHFYSVKKILKYNITLQ